jgi:FkbM family methyltransferase
MSANDSTLLAGAPSDTCPEGFGLNDGARIMGILERILRNLRDVAVFGPSFPLRHISGLLGRRYHVTTIHGAGTIHIRPNSTDAETFTQIFGNRDYDLSQFRQFPRLMTAYQRILAAGQIPIIIDAGANVGAASLWFARQFPQSRIFAVEPDTENGEMCRLNTRHIPNVKVIDAAIGSEVGWASLSNPRNEAWAFETTRDANGKISIETIPRIVCDIRDPAKLFLVKIDIQGFEEDLFETNTGWVDEVEVIIIEPHDWLFPGEGKSRNFQKVLGEHDFEVLVSGENLIYIRLPRRM